MNTINIIGVVRKSIDEYFRYFEYETPYTETDSFETPTILIRNWTTCPNHRLIMIPEGTRLAIHGHIDMHEKHGTVLVVEQYQTIGRPL